jgi:cold-inducible RNA-binding protein
MSQKLFVGGLSYVTTDQGLQKFFSQAGEVVSATVVMNRDTGRSRGFGFVEMMSAAGTRRAVADLNRRKLDGHPLRVELLKPWVDGYASPRDGEPSR